MATAHRRKESSKNKASSRRSSNVIDLMAALKKSLAKRAAVPART